MQEGHLLHIDKGEKVSLNIIKWSAEVSSFRNLVTHVKSDKISILNLLHCFETKGKSLCCCKEGILKYRLSHMKENNVGMEIYETNAC